MTSLPLFFSGGYDSAPTLTEMHKPTPIAREIRTEESDARSQAELAGRRIYEDIVAGALGFGTKLQPQLLKDRYGLGLGPIREALTRLSAEGLIHFESQRGFTVPPLSMDEIHDIGRVRALLSGYALRRSIELGDEDWEAEVVAAHHRLDRLTAAMEREPETYVAQWLERNFAFHAALEGCVDSPLIKRMTGLVFKLLERYKLQLSNYSRHAVTEAQKEHRELLEAALKRDADKAVRILEAHIRSGTERIVARTKALEERQNERTAVLGRSRART